MSVSSRRCWSAVSVFFEGQSMLRTVATQMPRISRPTAGASRGVGAVDGLAHATASADDRKTKRRDKMCMHEDDRRAGREPALAIETAARQTRRRRADVVSYSPGSFRI